MYQLIIIHQKYFTFSFNIKLNKFRDKVRKPNTSYLVLLLRRLKPNKNSAPRRARFNEKNNNKRANKQKTPSENYVLYFANFV